MPDPSTSPSPLLAAIRPEAQRGSRGVLLGALSAGMDGFRAWSGRNLRALERLSSPRTEPNLGASEQLPAGPRRDAIAPAGRVGYLPGVGMGVSPTH